MGFSFGGTQANVTLDSAALTHRINASIEARDVINTTTTVGTVGASKKWTILGFLLSGQHSGASAGYVKLVAGTKTLGIINLQATATAAQISHVGMTFPYEDALQLTATQTVTLQSSSATTNGAVTVLYIEESA